MDKVTVPNLMFVNVQLDGQESTALAAFVYQDVFMDIVRCLSNADVNQDGKECFVTNVS